MKLQPEFKYIVIIIIVGLIIKSERIQNLKRITFIILLFLIINDTFTIGLSVNASIGQNQDYKIISGILKEIEIPAKNYYIIKYSQDNNSFLDEYLSPTKFLSETIIKAIAKSPSWLQRDLTRQLKIINNPEVYANLILESSKKFTDEIAFSIAHSPIGKIPPVDVIRDNVFYLYTNDQWIKYTTIKDICDENGNYYSTIKYLILDGIKNKEIYLPKDIYYWYVVHPELLGGNAKYIYDSFWRNYIFNHNDIGYPLLKEKIQNIEYLWDNQSYSQEPNRLWTKCIKNHPTAIEAISYWIGKTVPYGAMGDRPSQPNIIAHEHNGWCGELQRIAVAAQRAVLVPSVGTSNVAEDHVWREFYEQGWHENDNWWTDSGGAVDLPKIYADNWGKNMSAIYSWKGDGAIIDATSTYIHPEDRINIKFIVNDAFLKPVDGALVTVLVKGLKDITFYKDKILEKMDEIWKNLPQILRGKISQNIYEKIYEKINDAPNIIDGATISIWNYTNPLGECTFKLGKNHEYIFLIQEPLDNFPWPIAKNNAIRSLDNAENNTFHIYFMDFSNKLQKNNNLEIPHGDLIFDISYNASCYQLQKNIRNEDIGKYHFPGDIEFFILDEENYLKFKNSNNFNSYNYVNEQSGNFEINALKNDYYLVFRNTNRNTNVVLDFSIHLNTSTDENNLVILQPKNGVFENPIFNVGDKINISGFANNNIELNINENSFLIQPKNNKWFHVWNTSGLIPGDYTIFGKSGNAKKSLRIKIFDNFPPLLRVNNPSDGQIFGKEILMINGTSSDNQAVKNVEIAINRGEFFIADGKENWSISYHTKDFNPGVHIITARCFDMNNRVTYETANFVINQSDYNSKPIINNFYHSPRNPLNTSNIVVYANVSGSANFTVKTVILHLKNNSFIKKYDMFLYGINPEQNRHVEDPLSNFSNQPIYGIELGQFDKGENITYFIEVIDMANNTVLSNENYFVIN